MTKDWGTELYITNTENYCCKRLVVCPGRQSSFHRHHNKTETFFIESGNGWLLMDQEPMELIPGAVVEIPAGTWHRFWCSETSPGLSFLEISQHHSDEDVERQSQSGPVKKLLRAVLEATHHDDADVERLSESGPCLTLSQFIALEEVCEK